MGSLYEKNYSKLDRFMFEHTILKNFRYIILNPFVYIIITIVNLFFISNQLPPDPGARNFILFLYVWSIIGATVYFLDKYRVVIFLNTKDTTIWKKTLKIYFYMSVGFFGLIIGAILLTVESLFYFLNVILLVLKSA